MLFRTHPLTVLAVCLALGAGMWAQPLPAQEFRTLPDGFPDLPGPVSQNPDSPAGPMKKIRIFV